MAAVAARTIRPAKKVVRMAHMDAMVVPADLASGVIRPECCCRTIRISAQFRRWFPGRLAVRPKEFSSLLIFPHRLATP